MAVLVRCPACRATHPITAFGQTTDWRCPTASCRRTSPRAGWLSTRPGGVGPDTFIDFGDGTRTKKFDGIMSGQIADQLFAGGDSSSIRGATRTAAQVPAPASGAAVRDTPVTIYIAADDVLLKGRFYTAAGAAAVRRVILYLSGSGGSAYDYNGEIISGYLNMPVPVLSVDYRGFGSSGTEGVYSSRAAYRDAEAMLACLVAPTDVNGFGYPMSEVLVHGYSLGSGPATELGRKHSDDPFDHIAGLILHCPMSSAADNAYQALREGGDNPVVSWIGSRLTKHAHGFQNIDKIGRVHAPILIIKGRRDGMAPQADALYDRARAKRGVVTRIDYDGGHLDRADIFQGGRLRQWITNLGPSGVNVLYQPATQWKNNPLAQ